MIPALDRFAPLFKQHQIELIVPDVHERLEEADLLRYAGQFDGAICGDDRYTEKALVACAPRLRIIVKWGTGIDSIDAAACSRLNITLARTPGAFTMPVADSVLGYILSFARQLPAMDRRMKSGAWRKELGRALNECTLGIVGVGNVGKAVAKRAQVCGMRLLGNDILEIDAAFLNETGMRMLPLDELLTEADFLSINCDLNPTSDRLINAARLGKMKPGAVLINTARGPIVDELALIAGLRAGRPAAAALDVFELEPLPSDSPLRGMDNVMLAPHNSNASPAAWERVHFNSIERLFEGLGLPSPGLT